MLTDTVLILPVRQDAADRGIDGVPGGAECPHNFAHRIGIGHTLQHGVAAYWVLDQRVGNAHFGGDCRNTIEERVGTTTTTAYIL